VEVNQPFAKAVLVTLAEVWPQALPFTEVLTRARARLGRQPADGSIDGEALAFFELLLQTYAPGLATLHLCPPKFSPRAGERPLASPLARWQVRSNDRVANLCHAPVVLENPSGRHLLSLLDGTRDRTALLRDMRPFIEANQNLAPSGDKTPATPAPTDEQLARNLENTLEVFARCALLVA
jgi:methyltransferase-like protein